MPNFPSRGLGFRVYGSRFRVSQSRAIFKLHIPTLPYNPGYPYISPHITSYFEADSDFGRCDHPVVAFVMQGALQHSETFQAGT